MFTRQRFGHVEIDATQRRLWIRGQPAALGSRAFDLLLALIDRRDRVVDKNELLDLVWPHLVVEENNLQVQVGTLRKLLGRSAIATIPGRGYQFTLAADDAAIKEGGPDDQARSMTNLQAETLGLVGRDMDIASLCLQIEQHRVVSVVGAGGIGKTRLARAVAARQLDTFLDGVWWVDLAAVNHGDRVAQAVANASGTVLGDGSAPALLANALQGRRLLLVLDNCEHVVGGVVELLVPLLTVAPGVRILATSQVALHVQGEQVWRLDALQVPPPGTSLEQARGFGALALFERRARAADQRFALDGASLVHAIELCRHLDGNALAIEMAAAWAPHIGVQALNQRLADRLHMLRGDTLAFPSRQQSLRGMLDWSCSLLSDVQRSVLRRLCVFAGSFGLAAAQQVAADDRIDAWAALDALNALVDRSLLHIDRLDPPRYRLLETTRLHACEQLAAAGETARVELLHGQAMAKLSLHIRDDYRVSSHPQMRSLYVSDYSDMDAAFERACMRSDASVGAATGSALVYLDAALGVSSERRRRMAAAHVLLSAASEPIDRALLWKQAAADGSIALAAVSRLHAARERAEAWRAVGDRPEFYVALAELAKELARAGDFVAARRTAAEALSNEDPGWPPRLRRVGAWLESDIALYSGEVLDSRHALRQSLALAEAQGDTRDALHARARLAVMAAVAGDLDDALTLGRAVVEEVQGLNQPSALGWALKRLCAAHLLAGDGASARNTAAAALPMLRANQDAGELFDPLALLAARDHDPQTAALLLGHADHWYVANQSPMREAVEAKLVALAVAEIDAAIGEAERTRLRREGAALGEAQADALAWRLLGGAPAV